MTEIQKACEAFRILLEEQQARIANANEEKKDFYDVRVDDFKIKGYRRKLTLLCWGRSATHQSQNKSN